VAHIYCTSDRNAIEPSELRVLDALRNLTDEWLVFHSVAWQSLRGRRQGDGEADLILLHRQIGLLVLEVKGGGIHVTAGNWTSTDGAGVIHEIKDPFTQAVASKHALLRFLAKLGPAPINCDIGHAVSFPHITIDENIATYGPRSLIIDRRDLENVAQKIDRIVEYHGLRSALTAGEVSRIVRLLAPTLRIRRTLRDEMGDAQQGLIDLTKRQVEALDQLRRNRRLLVLGGAGTGKTVLASARARQHAENGGSVLYVCYNKLLADHMRAELAEVENVRAESYFSLCADVMRDSKRAWPQDPPPEWWSTEAPTALVDSATTTGLRFDAIVVDEGQDFADNWLESLLVLTTQPEESPVSVFADSHQDLYARQWTLPRTWPICELDVNCRNTRQISDVVASVYRERSIHRGVDGPAVAFLEGNVDRDGPALVQQVAYRLMEEERISPKQIVVLSDDAATARALREQTIIGDHVLCAAGETGIICETISRYKGLEADAVILALSPGLPANEESKAKIYVGLSRPRTLLYVIAPRELWNWVTNNQAARR
jgi:Nuclease-related domain/AAA domain